ncbi:MAG: hypothetical protein JRD89_01585 [Deltaproteobacteria bacterium]|nr:hypothetical protein [Deltaproteobacteria bacterium]
MAEFPTGRARVAVGFGACAALILPDLPKALQSIEGAASIVEATTEAGFLELDGAGVLSRHTEKIPPYDMLLEGPQCLLKDFTARIAPVAYTMGAEAVNKQVNGVLVETQDPWLQYVATNRRRLARINYPDPPPAVPSFMIQRDFVEGLKLFDCGAAAAVTLDNGRVRVEAGDFVGVADALPKFPDYRQAIPAESGSFGVLNKEQTLKFLDNIKEVNTGCTFVVTSLELLIQSQEAGEVSVPMHGPDKSFTFRLSPKQFFEAVANAPGEQASLYFDFLQHEQPLLILSGNYEAVVMPYRS